jgi:hypothetical protein
MERAKPLRSTNEGSVGTPPGPGRRSRLAQVDALDVVAGDPEPRVQPQEVPSWVAGLAWMIRHTVCVDSDIVTPGGIVIPARAIAWRFSRGTGPGGQGVNTTDGGVVADPAFGRITAGRPQPAFA